MKLKRGFRYGLLGKNDSGKTTLMRSIANGMVEGFPSPDEVRFVFVEADILGELSHLNCADYVFEDPRIQSYGISMGSSRRSSTSSASTPSARPRRPTRSRRSRAAGA